jgi:NAD+ diphosphatase
VGEAVAWVAPADAPDGVRVLLGDLDGVTYAAVVAVPELAEDDWLPVRGLLPMLAAADNPYAPLVMHAIGIAEWLAVTRFCPRCAEPLTPRSAGHELACANGHVQFPRSDPAVIMVVAHGEPGAEDERCLLGHQAVWPEGRYSTLAGFCEPGETLEDAVRREVHEEVGVRVGEVSYLASQPWPLPASLMLGFVGRALTTEIQVDEDEIADARWFTRAELKAAVEDGSVLLPGGVSISHSLMEHWYGGPLPGRW